MDYYNNLRQAASEPLHEYHQKITAALDTLKAIGAPIPTAEEQGRRVVKSLDPSRYSDYQMRLHNRLVEGERDVYPKTLDAAFDIASKLLRTTHARDQPQSTMQARVLVAEQSHKRDKKRTNRISDFSNKNKNGDDRSTNINKTRVEMTGALPELHQISRAHDASSATRPGTGFSTARSSTKPETP